jgi:hypothetical protein
LRSLSRENETAGRPGQAVFVGLQPWRLPSCGPPGSGPRRLPSCGPPGSGPRRLPSCGPPGSGPRGAIVLERRSNGGLLGGPNP